MNDLVLRSRLDTLRRTLVQVGAFRQQLDEARVDLSNLDQLLAPMVQDSIRTHAAQALNKLDNAIRTLEDTELPDDDGVVEAVGVVLQEMRDAKSKAEQVRVQAAAAYDIIKGLQRRWVEINDGGGVTLDRQMENLATKYDEMLTKVYEALRNVGSEEDLRAVWAVFEDLLHGQIEPLEPLFNDYVDLLGGLALRSLGIGHETCQRADFLLRQLRTRSTGPSWNSVAVPAHAEALDMTPAQLIRLGFPGWTIWELPLAAHDFGHAVAASIDPIKKTIEAERWQPYGERFLTTLFADGYATYSLGPAYACAALLLRLDPAASVIGSANEPSDALRAQMTLGMLRAINDDDTTYNEIIGELDTEWRAAANQQAGAPGSAELSDERVDRWCETVYELLHHEMSNAEYSASRWKMISGWVLEVGSGRVPTPNADTEVRDVLNVAWQSRAQNLPLTETIESTALKFWDVVTKGRPEAGLRDKQRVVAARSKADS